MILARELELSTAEGNAMSVLAEIRARFGRSLAALTPGGESFTELIRPAQDPRFGDYQVNCAMPLEKKLGRPARQIASELVAATPLDDLATVEVAGPGFINLKLREPWIHAQLQRALSDPRLRAETTRQPKTFVVDFSSPNVAKPMHVGHIRSTVIGDALTKILRFAGHRVITDNHLGDWGTQFGMIIYGYRHFVDAAAYLRSPIDELGRLYRLVRTLSDYHEAVREWPAAGRHLEQLQSNQMRLKQETDPAQAKQRAKELAALADRIREQEATGASLERKIKAVESNAELAALARTHADIEQAVLDETARLHADDAANLALWHEFLPHCRADIQDIYRRLHVEFDHELGESFYHERLAGVVASLREKGLAVESDGAICVFLDSFETPMIVQKKDGAFLYSTSDLATIQYRVEQWKPDAILYVVDHRQHEHFEKLFAAAKKWGFDGVELIHVSFGTVLGDDGTPFKTRAGDTVGLRGLLDEAAQRARAIVDLNYPELDESSKSHIAETVGIGALKYADLSHNRTSDYKFSYDKMLALNGNTATYLQYLYARVNGVMSKGQIDVAALRRHPQPFDLSQPVERKLAIQLLRFGDAIADVLIDFKPNVLTGYLFELTQTFFEFYEQCKILEADSDARRVSRLQLSDLAGRTVQTGLSLLGIQVVEQM
jgi:arginyl-tRNA synthetase